MILLSSYHTIAIFIISCTLHSRALPASWDNPHAFSSVIEPTLNPYPDKPRITFKQDGTFKLMIFADIHYGENPWDTWGPQQDVDTSLLMGIALTIEKPDYV